MPMALRSAHVGDATSRNQAFGISLFDTLLGKTGRGGTLLTAVTARRFPLRFLDAANVGNDPLGFRSSGLDLLWSLGMEDAWGGGSSIWDGALPRSRGLRPLDVFMMASNLLIVKDSEVVDITRLARPSSTPSMTTPRD